MTPKFDLLKAHPKKNQDAISSLLKESINQIIDKQFKFEDTLFSERGVEIKLLLQSYPALFWSLWDHLDLARTNTQKNQATPIQKLLNEDGVAIVKNYFSKEKADEFRLELDRVISNLPSNKDPEIYKESCLYRHYVRQDKEQGTRIIVGSPYDTKRIALFGKEEYAPKTIVPLFSPSHPLNRIVSDYMGIDTFPSDISFEKACAPLIYRDNDWWHIDNLTDQFKVMIIIKDMTEKDGPFKFIKGTHSNFSEQEKCRYHKMYALMGLGTQESNHFEETFAKKAYCAEAPILEAGDVILFDCKIQHSWDYAYDGGERKNILLSYFNLPTPKNIILGEIDKYLKFHR